MTGLERMLVNWFKNPHCECFELFSLLPDMWGLSVVYIFFSTSTLGTVLMSRPKCLLLDLKCSSKATDPHSLTPAPSSSRISPLLQKTRIRRQGESHSWDIKSCLSQCSFVKLCRLFLPSFSPLHCSRANKGRKQWSLTEIITPSGFDLAKSWC